MDESTPNYSEIAQSPRFKELLARKKAFILPITCFFLAFYFALPLMTSYSTALNKPAIGAISVAWLFAFAQFVMTWVLCSVYSKRAAEFDRMAEEVVQEGLV